MRGTERLYPGERPDSQTLKGRSLGNGVLRRIQARGTPLPVPSGMAFPGRPGLPLFAPLPDARGRPIPLHPSPGGAPLPFEELRQPATFEKEAHPRV
jgi:hypothetical protein